MKDRESSGGAIDRSRFRSRRFFHGLAALTLLGASIGVLVPSPASGQGGHVASNWFVAKFVQPQGAPQACTGFGFLDVRYFDRLDCGFGGVQISGTTAASNVLVNFIGPDGGVPFESQTATFRSDFNEWRFTVRPKSSWPAGVITVQVNVAGDADIAGETTFFHNLLGATIGPAPRPGGGNYRPGEDVPVSGILFEQDQIPPLAAVQKTNVSGSYSLQVVTPTGEVRGPFGPFTADKGGTGLISETLPGSATAGLTATAETNFQVGVAIEAINASFNDPANGAWAAKRAGAGALVLSVPPDTLLVENSFVSDVGWVKPGQTYPFRVFVKNFTLNPATGGVVVLPPVDGMRFANVAPATGSGAAVINPDGSITWTIGDVPAAGDAGPALKTLVVAARADTLGEDPEIVWKDIATTATLTYNEGASGGLISRSHGPKVIPPDSKFNTARYGDRPFPVVPVDYSDREHTPVHTGDQLANVINSPAHEGSTLNLYQEMSYGQLFPTAKVPSAGTATAGWDVSWSRPKNQQDGFQFTELQPQGTCKGNTFKDVKDTPLYPERIRSGWYQLPGDTEYYGGDASGSALPLVIVGAPGSTSFIDSACGPISKAVYDAAHIADPEIDYSDYDTDKDGVVDFFMMVYVGLGGNGVSQTSVPPYDNIWPHSFTLEFFHEDPETGQRGYVSDDQLKDLEGRLLYHTDASRSVMTTDTTEFPVYVRVGPYNVNPESAIDHASVISHEYGHSLGLPDFYSVGGRETYGTWNLMATDYSQNMDIFSRQELGWVVPRVLPPGETTVTNWQDSKVNTHRIDWVRPDGTPYTLQGPNVNNGEAYTAKLPVSKHIVDPAKVQADASPDHVWWSFSGNEFGCAPEAGHNLDVFLPELADVPAGTPVTVTLKSYWDIEWDFDYGFVLVSTDGGESYQSVPSEKGFTTEREFNPNLGVSGPGGGPACQDRFGNGLTGTSGSYAAGSQNEDRVGSTGGLAFYPDGSFLEDEYRLTFAAGKATVLRFSYSTDPGLFRPGWSIDDLKITAGDEVIYQTDFETGADDPRLFNGGCRGSLAVAKTCTDGWLYLNTSGASPLDHAYYLEMRDRSGFDFDAHGQNDRGPITFAPGLALVYTDEGHGYGNVGVDDPPAQHILDSQPTPGDRAPALDDAAWTDALGDSAFSDSGEGHTDNYTDPRSRDGDWHFQFDCLSFEVLSMSGEGAGPSTSPGDLRGDVKFTVGAGCRPQDYGFGVPNTAPTAVAQAKPTTATTVQPVTFDGSGSFDALDPPGRLTYEWDFEGDGTYDATGQIAVHTYPAPGIYPATLRVTDTGGLSDTDTISITVSCPFEGRPYWEGWDIARDVVLLPGSQCAGYVLDGWGAIFPFGGAPAIKANAYWPRWDIARSIDLNPDGKGGYVLDAWGSLHPFAMGDNPMPSSVADTPYWPGSDLAKDFLLVGNGSGYILDGYGGVHAFGGAVPAIGGPYWSGWDIARAISPNPDGGGGYVLDGYGGVHAFGGAPAVGGGSYFGFDIARDLAFLAPGKGLVLDGYGGVHPFGGAPAVVQGVYFPGLDIANALALSQAGDGLVLDGWGGRHRFSLQSS